MHKILMQVQTSSVFVGFPITLPL